MIYGIYTYIMNWVNAGSFDHDGADIHVYPLDDIQPHNTETRHCWCAPVTNNDEPSVIVHNRAKDNPQ